MAEHAMTRVFRERLWFAPLAEVEKITREFMGRFGPLVWREGLSSEDVSPKLRNEMCMALFHEIRPLIRGDPTQNAQYPDDEAIKNVALALLKDIDHEIPPAPRRI